MRSTEEQIIEAGMDYLESFDRGEIISVDEFVIRYPAEIRDELRHHLEALVAFGDEAEFLADDEVASPSDLEWELSRYRSRMRSEPTMTLTQMRQALKLSLGRVATRLNIPVGLLDRLERGSILVATIPDRFVARLAETLQRSEAELRLALTAAPLAGGNRLQEGQSVYLSARDGTRPLSEEAISFAEALNAFQPTPAQRTEWEAGP